MVKLGPASAMLAPTSTWSAVGEVRDVAAELIPSLTNAFTETDAVLVVLQLPALPLHCAPAWVTLMADPSTIAARRKRVAFIEFVLQGLRLVDMLAVGKESNRFLPIRRDPWRFRNEKNG